MRQLEFYETEIERGLDLGRQGYELISRSLLSIQEAELWVGGYISFEDYGAKKWRYGRSYVNRLVSAGRFLLTLEGVTIGTKALAPPPNEAICREVLKVKAWEQVDGSWRVNEAKTPQKRLDTWEMVSSQLNGQVMTALDVRDLIDIRTGRGIKSGPSLDKRKKQALMQLGKAMDRFCKIRWTDGEKRTYGKQIRNRVQGW